jgi:ADP-heptose:LPS heptosyltransferase
MKSIVVTIIDKCAITELTCDRIESYAKKIKSDFKVLPLDENISNTLFHISIILNSYDRLIYISSNILIREDAPNLFDIVPDDTIGLFNEGRYADRNLHMKSAISYYDETLVKDWEGKYYNSDVIVISKKHRGLFKKPNIKLGAELSPYLNLKIHNTETKVFSLSYKFNRMENLDSEIGISRLDSYFINYINAPFDIIRDIVEKDIKQWQNDAPHYVYKRNIVIKLSAGLGDQIESEPVIRFVRKIYPEANIYVTTHHPRIFKHLINYDIKVFDYLNWKGINEASIIMENNPTEAKSINRLTQVLFHPTDFSSISMIRRTIPFQEKTIHIDVDAAEIESVIELMKERNKEKEIIVINAGKWWKSKTFPKKWWQRVVDLLSEELCVVLIGVTLSEKQGYLDIECPKDGFDFRDYTSLGENIALISLSKVTLSNDSSPIHIAGAFDNWIVAIPTSKHPDHILPWRNGSQSYKTKCIYKKLLHDDLELRHTEFYFDTIDNIPKDKTIEEYLPEPEEVVNEVFDIYFNQP